MLRLQKSLSETIRLLRASKKENEWEFSVRGQKLTVYEQKLTPITFSCTCPDHEKKQTFCKHLLFLVARVGLQMEMAAHLHSKKKEWNESLFASCTLSWTNRLSHLVGAAPVSVKNVKDVRNSGDDCSICFETMESKETITCETTCKNQFHKECIVHWLDFGNKTCPLCRTEWNKVATVADDIVFDRVVEEVAVEMIEMKNDESKESEESIQEKKMITTDLVFSFDTTGSMYPCLAEVKRSIEKISTKLFQEMPGLRLAIIAHGDYCDRDKVISILDFTTDQDVINNFIKNAPSTSGGDYPECYELVLRRSKELSWRPDADMKSLVMIGDAPPHEPNENPEKINWRVEAESLRDRNVQVFSVQCLNNGNYAAFDFYSEIAKVTNGYHVFLDQFSYIKDMIQAICFKQYNHSQLEEFEREIQSGESGMTQTMRLMFDTILGKKSREEVHAEMHPDRFRERYGGRGAGRGGASRGASRASGASGARAAVSHHTEMAMPSLERESELRPCHPSKFQVFNVEEDSGIQTFCASMGIAFAKGKGFYEFTKPEIVQPQKEIVLMDRVTGELYEGEVARTIAGIKKNEERSKIKPSDIPKYRVFIQSTSPNRKLIGGQGFLYEVMSEE